MGGDVVYLVVQWMMGVCGVYSVCCVVYVCVCVCVYIYVCVVCI